MRLALLALLVVGCNGCSNPLPPAPGPTTPPAPVMADGGAPCSVACAAAHVSCGIVVMSVEECTLRCAEGMRQLTGNSPACLAGTLTCSNTKGCP